MKHTLRYYFYFLILLLFGGVSGVFCGPSSADEYAKKAREYYDTHDYNRALELYLQAIEMEEKPEYYYWVGNCYYFKKDYRTAIKYYDRAIEGGYSNKQYAYYNAACCYALVKDGWESFRYLGIAIFFGYHDFTNIQIDPDLAFLRESLNYDFSVPGKLNVNNLNLNSNERVIGYTYDYPEKNNNKNLVILFSVEPEKERELDWFSDCIIAHYKLNNNV